MNETQVILVRYWAAARAAAGTATEEVALSAPVTLADLRAELLRRHAGASRFADVLAVCSVLLGDRPVRSQDPASVVVPAGVPVEFLPPFAGG